jgi:DNA-binding CsgD family transcriptional regulator
VAHDVGDVAALERGRDAAAHGAWPEAYAALKQADDGALEPPDLATLADAAWWVSEPVESLAYRQRAYAGFASAGDDERAAAMAARLAIEFFQLEQPSVGGGWLARAQRHAHDVPEFVGHGYLAMIEATVLRYRGDLDTALELARHAAELGSRFADRDLLAMAIHIEGLVQIASGRVAEGLSLLDESMTSVIAGELTPYFTGVIYCNVIATCLDLGDLTRAREWDRASRAWCETLSPGSPWPARCRVNRAVVTQLSGSWDDAEDEAARAADELAPSDPIDARYAFYLLGELRRRRGNLSGAGEAFERAREMGSDALPGLALLRLDQGRPEAAAAAMRSMSGMALPPEQARIVATGVEVAIANGDLGEAARLVGSLETLAAAVPAATLQALAAGARGSVLLAEGDPRGAEDPLRRACELWLELRLPYEAARARVTLGRAALAVGDRDGATEELGSALATFERLGAAPDATRVALLLTGSTTLPAGLTAREVEVLRAVASGKTNRDIAVELVISEHTVGRHLQNIYAKLGVSTRAAATAFAFEHGLM